MDWDTITKLGVEAFIVAVFLIYMNKRDKVLQQISDRCHETTDNNIKVIAQVAAESSGAIRENTLMLGKISGCLDENTKTMIRLEARAL